MKTLTSMQRMGFEPIPFISFWLPLLLLFLPSANEVAGRYYFYTCVSFCSQEEGSLSGEVSVRGVLCPGGSLSRGASVQGVLSPGGLCPGDLCPGGHCPGGSLFGGGLCLGRSLSGGVSVRETPQTETLPPHTVTSGWYASYWNALFLENANADVEAKCEWDFTVPDGNVCCSDSNYTNDLKIAVRR